MMGHKSAATTTIYLHTSNERMTEAVERIGQTYLAA